MSPRKNRLDEEIAALYAAPLESFIADRNALASRLKKEKDREGSDEVKALRKPTPSAWAVNRLFQHEPERMEELLGAGERARKALHEAITSGGAESLRGAIQEARGLIEELRQRALEFLSEGGRSANPAMGERIGTNLQSLTFTPAAAETAGRGWLDADLDPPGFEVLAGLQVAAGASRPKPARPVKEAPPIRPHSASAEERQAREEARRREAEEARSRREAERARREPAKEKAKAPAPSLRDREEARLREWREREEARLSAQREREEARLREKLETAEQEAERTAAEAAALQEEAAEAAKAAAEARKKAERSQDQADRAAEALARAREALEEVRKGAKVLAHPGASGGQRR